MICVTTQRNVFSGGGVAQWLARWICALKAPGSNRPPCHWIDLCLVLPDATSPRFAMTSWSASRQLGVLTCFCSVYNDICLLISVSTISTEVLNTPTLK